MADDPNDPNKDEEGFEEEYEFEESEFSSELPPESEENSFASDSMESDPSLDLEPEPPPEKKIKMLPALITLGILGFVGWKLYGYFTAPEPVAPTPAQTPVAVPAPKPAPAAAPAPAPSAPATSLPALENVPSGPTPEQEIMTKVEKRFEEEKKLLDQRMHALETSINALSENGTNTNRTIGQLQQDLRALTGIIRNMEAQSRNRAEAEEKARRAAEAAKAAKLKKKEGPGPEAFANPTLTVYAIIPGRAWLRTPANKTITVSEGDPVGEYGKVVKIDAVNGTVVTSSGITLR